jgi:hypothetical protein
VIWRDHGAPHVIADRRPAPTLAVELHECYPTRLRNTEVWAWPALEEFNEPLGIPTPSVMPERWEHAATLAATVP